MYAKRVEDNVPVFSEKVTVRNNSQRTKLYPSTTGSALPPDSPSGSEPAPPPRPPPAEAPDQEVE
eukprot:106628-Karenia_brevis.AAC.1